MHGRWTIGLWLLAWGLSGWPGPVAAQEAAHPWLGRVTWVSDGDTLWVRPAQGGEAHRIRLHGVDAPEICQVYGTQSRDRLAERVLGRTVRVQGLGRDDYQRLLARVALDGQDLGHWLVSEGLAWSYRFRDDPGPYAAQEAAAQAAGRGLFARGDAIRPRVFRRRHGSCH